MSNVLLLIRVLKKYSSRSLTLLLFFSMFIAVCTGGAGKLLSLIVDAVPAGALVTAILFLVLSAVLRLLGTSARLAQEYYNQKISGQLALSIQKDVLDKVDKLPFSTFEEESTQNLIHRIYANSASDGSNLLKSLSASLYGILITAVYAVLLGNIAWYIPLVFVGFSLGSLFFSLRFGMNQYMLKRQQSKTQRRADYYEHLLLRRDAAKEIRLYRLTELLNRRYIDLLRKLAKEDRQQLTKHILLELFGKFLQAVGLFLCLAVLVIRYQSSSGAVPLSDILLIFSIGLSFFDELNGALMELRSISRFYAFAQDSMTFLELQEEARDGSDFVADGIDDISFEHVSFRYPGSEQYALRDVCVHLRRGEKLVCVGENGAGKSTFLMLLLGLYQPSEGEIKVNGTPLKGKERAFRDNYCSTVVQHYAKYHMSVEENIALTGSDCIDAEQKEKIMQRLIGFVKDLPFGMQTFLGNLMEDSSELSGGQWQRLCICRALLKNAPVLVLDEPTAALDPLTESALYSDLLDNLTDRLCVISSHRLGICRLADRILVFRDGQLITSGTHDELLRQDETYRSLFESQRMLMEE